MNDIVLLVGAPTGLASSLAVLLRHHGLTVMADTAAGDGADMLVTLPDDAERAIAAARDFAACAGARDRLVVHLLPPPAAADWPRSREGAILRAFTRHAGLGWAARNIRVNAIIPAAAVPLARRGERERAPEPVMAPVADIADTMLALRRWRAMTGQTIELGG